ncbi:TPA: N-6 DNA methylase, partial [Streptococcus pyogenes]|nr:N-6 DNA methylase [Streptococcus pyogenes]
MEIDARGSEKSLSFCYLKIDNIFCVSRLTREGSGSLLLNAKKYSHQSDTVSYYGQEINTSTYNLA